MARENKLLILGAMFAVAVVGQAELMEIKNEDTVMFLEESNKEADDSLFIRCIRCFSIYKFNKKAIICFFITFF